MWSSGSAFDGNREKKIQARSAAPADDTDDSAPPKLESATSAQEEDRDVEFVPRPDGMLNIIRPAPIPPATYTVFETSKVRDRDILHPVYTCDLTRLDAHQKANGGQVLTKAIFDRKLPILHVPCPLAKLHVPHRNIGKPLVISWSSPQGGELTRFADLFGPKGENEYTQTHDLRKYMQDLGLGHVDHILPYMITAETDSGPLADAEIMMDLATPKAIKPSRPKQESVASAFLSSSSSSVAPRDFPFIQWVNQKAGTTIFAGGEATSSHTTPFVDTKKGEQTLYLVDSDGELARHPDFTRWMAMKPDTIYHEMENLLVDPNNRRKAYPIDRIAASIISPEVVYPEVSDDPSKMSYTVWFWLAHGRTQMIQALTASDFARPDLIKDALFTDHADADDDEKGAHRIIIFVDFLRYSLGQFFNKYNPNNHVMPVGDISLTLRSNNPSQASHVYYYNPATPSARKPLFLFRITLRIYFDVVPRVLRKYEDDSHKLFDIIRWYTNGPNPIPAASGSNAHQLSRQ